jgi:hypothetical protein
MSRESMLHEIMINIKSGKGSVMFEPNDVGCELIRYDDQLKVSEAYPPLPDKTSMISGEPALIVSIYMHDHPKPTDVLLTPKEMQRFLLKSLKKPEWKILHAAYGDIYELHCDFYDQDGAAADPQV